MMNVRLTGLISIAAAVVLAATTAHAGRRWQCGDGTSVPLRGSRADRQVACKKARAERERQADARVRDKAAELEQRVRRLEQLYGVSDDTEPR